MTDHLRPCAPIAPDALLPGDPGRALALAQDLLEAPRMANHARGLWGYTGATADGTMLTIQATGVGGPSVAVVLTELASLGVRRGIRIGTCRALVPELEPGDLLAVAAAIGADGTSAALGAEASLKPDRALAEALLAGSAALRPATVVSADLYYDPSAGDRDRDWLEAGAEAIDLGTAPALALGARPGLAIACGLVVARSADGRALADDEVEAASIELARAGAAALALPPAPDSVQPPASGTVRLP